MEILVNQKKELFFEVQGTFRSRVARDSRVWGIGLMIEILHYP